MHKYIATAWCDIIKVLGVWIVCSIISCLEDPFGSVRFPSQLGNGLGLESFTPPYLHFPLHVCVCICLGTRGILEARKFCSWSSTGAFERMYGLGVEWACYYYKRKSRMGNELSWERIPEQGGLREKSIYRYSESCHNFIYRERAPTLHTTYKNTYMYSKL